MMNSTVESEQPQRQRLKFVPFSSAIESSFWVQYNRLKLETIKLSEEPIPIQASYSVGGGETTTSGLPRFQCQEGSLLAYSRTQPQQQQLQQQDATTTTATHSLANERVTCHGHLLGYNTLEAFQTVDKNELLKRYFLTAFFNNNDDIASLNSLTSFLLLTFADLKQHQVVYWFAFPTLAGAPLTTTTTALPMRLSQSPVYSPHVPDLVRQFQQLRKSQLDRGLGLPPFFVWFPFCHFDHDDDNHHHPGLRPLSKQVLLDINDDNHNRNNNNVKDIGKDVVFGFLDPAASHDPGWPMRNLAAYLCFHFNLGGQPVTILSYRPTRLRRLTLRKSDNSDNNNDDDEDHFDFTDTNSLLWQVRIPTKAEYYGTDMVNDNDNDAWKNLKVTGWESNVRGKPGPRCVNLRPLLDPRHLAIQAADLNLKLMKWRMIPDLQVELLQQQTRVLLLGAGTLGCNVARICLGWGIRHYVFVDNGTVSYSNPVRQPLFTMDDCCVTASSGGGGKPKAQAAADALKLIAPDVQAEGITLSIPMPGHVESKNVIEKAVKQLDELIQQANVVFLLTDTRESRWLPTVICAAHNKLLLNAALGLDSYLVMRHGNTRNSSSASSDAIPGNMHQKLGCYFCNDVVAPENSTKNRTLDQQCTVTRPGLAPLASSLAVELMVALLHHPQRGAAPAPKVLPKHYSPTLLNDANDTSGDAAASSALGLLPHQVRGSLVTYTVMTPTVPAFRYCSGCAPTIIEAYQHNSIELVYQVCQSTDGKYLEDLAGLTEFHAKTAARLDAMMADNDDGDDWGLEEDDHHSKNDDGHE